MYRAAVATGERYLTFRCTGCGNCCKEPLLPLTDTDLARILGRTGERARDVVRWVSRQEIDLDDEPESFVLLRPGRRVMVLGHGRRGCRYLGRDDRCTIYGARPLGCRIFPFDPDFKRDGSLRRLRLIQAAECDYALDGHNDIRLIRSLHERHDETTERYHQRVAEWNQMQRRRQRRGVRPEAPAEFLRYLGFDAAGA